MKIVVKKNNERDIRLSCPNWIAVNRITASFICKKLRDYGIYIKRRQLLKFYKLCKQYKKKKNIAIKPTKKVAETPDWFNKDIKEVISNPRKSKENVQRRFIGSICCRNRR